MSIHDKIEEIRQKPEHIRMRYVVALVAISMAFIITIWIFSLKAEMGKNQKNPSEISTEEFMQQFNTGKQSLEEAKDNISGIMQQQDLGLEE